MSYSALETSDHSGSPIELVEFQRGLKYWRYSTNGSKVKYEFHDFEPYPFDIPEIQQTVEIARGELNISTPVDTPIVAEFLASPMVAVIDVTIYRKHRTDAEVATVWVGYVAGVKVKGDEATITCQQMGNWLKQAGGQRPAQRQCPHALFDIDCRLVAAAWGESGSLLSISGATVTASLFAGHPDGWWVGGIFEADGTLRMIVDHVDDTITLTSQIPGMAANADFIVYPGCDHTPGTCDSKFGNILNNGGLPWLPVKNPFSGDSSF